MTPHSRLFNRLVFGLSAAVFLAGSPVLSAENGTSFTCTVIIDAESGDRLHRQGSCDRTASPMSTFKLPLAMMGFDAGLLTDAHRPSIAYDPHLNASERERKTTDPTVWMKDSIVWYSQALTARLGDRGFAGYVSRFGYGNGDVSGEPGKNNGLTHAWLMTSLQISPDEQAQFLRRFLQSDLPISDHAVAMTTAIVPHFQAGDGWDVQGKTGSGWMRDRQGRIDRKRSLGWFVGWATKGERRIVFARLESRDNPVKFGGLAARDAFIKDLPQIAAGF